MADAAAVARVRRQGFLMAAAGPIVSAVGFLGVTVMAELELGWIPRGIAGALGLAMAGGIVMVYSGLWYWITGRDQKGMSPREKLAFFSGFVAFVALGVVAVVMLDAPTPSHPPVERGFHPEASASFTSRP